MNALNIHCRTNQQLHTQPADQLAASPRNSNSTPRSLTEHGRSDGDAVIVAIHLILSQAPVAAVLFFATAVEAVHLLLQINFNTS